MRDALLEHARKGARARAASPLSLGALARALDRPRRGGGALRGDGTAAGDRAAVVAAVRALVESSSACASLAEPNAAGARGPLAQPIGIADDARVAWPRGCAIGGVFAAVRERARARARHRAALR